MDMPLDVLLETAAHLDPRDILSLARTSRALRNILMSKQSRHVWHAAIKNAHYPSCPDNMSEPRYAALLFDSSYCTECGGSTTNTPIFSVGIRLCGACSRFGVCKGEYLLDTRYNASGEASKDDMLLTMVPFEPRAFWSEKSDCDAQSLRGERFHMGLFREIAKQHYDLLSSETSRDVVEGFVKEQQAKARKTVLHANDIRLRHMLDKIDRDDAKEAFCDAAARKLLELGYTKRQLRETTTHFGTEWRKHTSKPRELTQRVRNNLRPKLEDLLRQNKERNCRCMRISLLLEDKIRAYEAAHGIKIWTYTPIEEGGLGKDLSAVKSFLHTYGKCSSYDEGATIIPDDHWDDILKRFKLRSELQYRWKRLQLH